MYSLPFQIDESYKTDKGFEDKLLQGETFNMLPEVLQEICRENIHLLVYLDSMRKSELELPEYHDRPGRNLKNRKDRNFLYPVDHDIFIHILSNSEDIRDYYIPIEPNLNDTCEELLDIVEQRLADYVDELEDISDTSKRIEIIYNLLDRFIVVGDEPFKKSHNGNGHKSEEEDKGLIDSEKGKATLPFLTGKAVSNNNGKKGKIAVSHMEYRSLKYLLKRKLEGMGILEPMIKDTNIEDISCSGIGNIFVEHKIFGGLKAIIGFENHAELDKFVIELAERIKHPVTFREPTVDATLPDGSRINIVFGTDVSKRGSNFTIRKFSPVPLSIIELVESGSMNWEMAAYLSIVIQEQMNVFVSGETASGKTTLINALTTFIPPNAKIVSIEDTPEVQVPHLNWIRGVTRESAKSSEASSVTMFDLLKAALRQRPNVIIIGEIRGAEGAIAFQAMQTGHACMATFHAATVTKLIQRFTGNPINVPKTYMDNLNVVVTCAAVRLPDGKTARRVTSINEIVGYDSVSDTFSFIQSFVWNSVNDTFSFKGYMNSNLLEYKIAPKRGLSTERRREIYSLIKKRATILQRLKEQGITNFYDVYAVLAKAYRDGQFR